MKQECYEIGKHLILLHIFLRVFGFDVNDMKKFTEVENIQPGAQMKGKNPAFSSCYRSPAWLLGCILAHSLCEPEDF